MQSAAYAMSLDDVVAFLREIEIEEPIQILQDCEYNGAEFLSVIESNELAELNLTSACQKLKVKVLFTRHLLKRVSDIAKHFPTSKVVEFCRTKKLLIKCAEVSLYNYCHTIGSFCAVVLFLMVALTTRLVSYMKTCEAEISVCIVE